MKCSPSSGGGARPMTHPDPAAEGGRDLDALRRSLRDVVALTMLPTVWAAYEPHQICTDLVDVISRMIDVEGVYLVAPSHQGGDILRLKQQGNREVERCLGAAAADRPNGNVKIVARAGGPDIHLLTFALSYHSADRFVVAACRPDFPTEI